MTLTLETLITGEPRTEICTITLPLFIQIFLVPPTTPHHQNLLSYKLATLFKVVASAISESYSVFRVYPMYIGGLHIIKLTFFPPLICLMSISLLEHPEKLRRVEENVCIGLFSHMPNGLDIIKILLQPGKKLSKNKQIS